MNHMHLPTKDGSPVILIVRVLFAVLLTNFISPALSFAISFFEIAPLFWLITLLDWFAVIVPFVAFALFYLTIRAFAWSTKKETSKLLMLQAALAFMIFVIWFERNIIHFSGYLSPLLNFAIQVVYIALIDILYLLFLIMLWRITKKQSSLELRSRFRSFYLWVNLVFLLSFALHSINSIDFMYYFHYPMPPELSWLFGHAPTILVSVTCLAGWALCLRNTREEDMGWVKHFALVLNPLAFALFVETFRPLIGFIIISMIVWGTSYEMFSPPLISLSLVLSAFGSFISFLILLDSQAKSRKRNLIRLGLASTVLAGISLSPASVLGVLAGLYTLLTGLKPASKEPSQ